MSENLKSLIGGVEEDEDDDDQDIFKKAKNLNKQYTN